MHTRLPARRPRATPSPASPRTWDGRDESQKSIKEWLALSKPGRRRSETREEFTSHCSLAGRFSVNSLRLQTRPVWLECLQPGRHCGPLWAEGVAEEELGSTKRAVVARCLAPARLPLSQVPQTVSTGTSLSRFHSFILRDERLERRVA